MENMQMNFKNPTTNARKKVKNAKIMYKNAKKQIKTNMSKQPKSIPHVLYKSSIFNKHRIVRVEQKVKHT